MPLIFGVKRIHLKIGMIQTIYPNHHQNVLPRGRSFTANSGTKAAVLLGMNRCGSFPNPNLSLAPEPTLKDVKRSQEPQRGGEVSGFG